MITLIILVVVFIVGLVLLYGFADDFEVSTLGFLITIFSAAAIIIHLLSWIIAPYNHDVFMQEREAIQTHIDDVRDSHRYNEFYAISKEATEWNIMLYKMQYQNQKRLLRPYIDNRIDDVKPIR